MVGFVFVLIMTATVIFQACANGLPGWYSGEFAAIGFQNIGAPTKHFAGRNEAAAGFVWS